MENEKVEEQGMSFSDILFLLKKNVLLIIIVTAVLTILGGIYALKIKKPTYTGEVTAIVMIDTSSKPNTTNTSDYVYASYYTDVFKSLIESNPVMTAAKEKLSLEYGYQDLTRDGLKSCINVSTQNNSLIMTISAKVQSKDDKEGREKAQTIANTVIDSAIEEANKTEIVTDKDGNQKEQSKYGVYANKLIVMERVEDPSDVKYSRGAGTTIVISLLIGLILSFGIILIKYLADDTFTSKDVFEKKFNIQVLSVIEEIKAPEETKTNEGGTK